MRNVSHLSGIITLSNLKLNIDWHSVAICISLALNNLIKNRLSLCVFRPSVRTDVHSCVCVRAFVMSTSLVKRSTNLRLLYCNYSAPDREAEYCDERVRLCVFACPRSYLHVRSSPNFYACYPWPWLGPHLAADTLCTSGFMDDVIFAHKPRSVDIATS